MYSSSSSGINSYGGRIAGNRANPSNISSNISASSAILARERQRDSAKLSSSGLPMPPKLGRALTNPSPAIAPQTLGLSNMSQAARSGASSNSLNKKND